MTWLLAAVLVVLVLILVELSAILWAVLKVAGSIVAAVERGQQAVTDIRERFGRI